MMETIVAGGMLVLVVVAVMLHLEDRRAREKIAALMDATRRGAEQPRPMQNHTTVRDWSYQHRNGPQIAKSEGVQRGSGHH